MAKNKVARGKTEVIDEIVVNRDTRSAQEQMNIVPLDVEGDGFPEMNALWSYLHFRSPDLYGRLAVNTNENGLLLEDILTLLLSDSNDRSGTVRLRAIVHLNIVINTVGSTKLVQEVPETVCSALKESLAKHLKDDDRRVRCDSVRALRALLNEDLKYEFVELLSRRGVGITDPDPETALASIALLADAGRYAASAAVEALSKSAEKHASSEVRLDACNGLGRLREDARPAMPTLRRIVMNEPDKKIASAAVDAMLATKDLDGVVGELTSIKDDRLFPLLRGAENSTTNLAWPFKTSAAREIVVTDLYKTG